MKFSLTKTKWTATLLIWILVYLSIIPTQLSNCVLCIGADGHIAFEVSINGKCTDTHAFDSEHIEGTHTGITTETDDCGPCIDLVIFPPLDTKLHLVSANDASTPPPILPFAILTYQKRFSTISTFKHSQHPAPLINPTLIYLRTTTLLI